VSDKNQSLEKDYWNNFYSKWVIEIPSQFCVQMLTEVDKQHTIVEFGSGNGRDSHYIAHQGHMVVAMDLSKEAVARSSSVMAERGIEHAVFSIGDVADEKDVARILAMARARGHASNSAVVVYCRFLLHSLDEGQEERFLTALSGHMAAGDSLYLEFRSSEDAGMKKIFGNHYRRYIDTDNLMSELNDRYNFATEYCLTGQGMAKYRDEDPFVSRVIAKKL